MTDLTKPQHEPSFDYPYFLFDAHGEGFMYFKLEVYRSDYAKHVIEGYMNDGWDEEVVNVVAGKLTHTTQMTNKEERPDNIDDEGYCKDDKFWDSDWDYRCDYELLELEPDLSNYDQSREGMCDDPSCTACPSPPTNQSLKAS